MSLKLEFKEFRMYRRTALVVFVFCMMASFSFFAMRGMQKTSAASAAGFNAGNIISDAVMANYNSMSVSDIQNFLTSKNPCNDTDYSKYLRLKAAYPNNDWHFENGHFICLSEERFGDDETIGSGQTAAEIIYQAAQDYKINPQVLLVLLQKEQGLITDTYPNKVQYRAATGFGCPDTAACSTKYYGFKNQVRNAASLFHEVLAGGWSNYPAYKTVYVQYNPNAGCGGTNVYIENRATSALYRYTPYQPNASALNAGYGTGDACGAYGNRNFYLYFTDWFGSTQKDPWEELATPRYFELTQDTIRVHPYMGDPIDGDYLEKGRILYYNSKVYLDGEWCFRTEHNTANNILACVPQKYVKEIELNYQDLPQSEQYKIINSGSQKTTVVSRETQKFVMPLIRRFTKKAEFLGETYYFTEFDTSSNSSFISGFTANNITNIDYQEISQYLVVGSNGADKLDLSDNQYKQAVGSGVARLYKAKITLNGRVYYQTEFDYNNNNSAYLIDGANLISDDEIYAPFTDPRALRLTKTVDRINPATGEYYDTLHSGQVIEFAQKAYVNGEWYYRTKHNTENDLFIAIPASATTEI